MSSSSSSSSSSGDILDNQLSDTSLSVVETVYVTSDANEQERSDASNSPSTYNTPFAHALSFNTIPPGGTSATIIMYLRVPNARAIGNIKLALINSGGIPFTNETFGVRSSSLLNASIVPETYFQGINLDKSSSSLYNASINNISVTKSEYVYINTTLPQNQLLGTGVLRFQWFFDYDGIDI